jgi:hypothetical protein
LRAAWSLVRKFPLRPTKKSATLFYKQAKLPLATFKIFVQQLDFAELRAQKQ